LQISGYFSKSLPLDGFPALDQEQSVMAQSSISHLFAQRNRGKFCSDFAVSYDLAAIRIVSAWLRKHADVWAIAGFALYFLSYEMKRCYRFHGIPPQ